MTKKLFLPFSFRISPIVGYAFWFIIVFFLSTPWLIWVRDNRSFVGLDFFEFLLFSFLVVFLVAFLGFIEIYCDDEGIEVHRFFLKFKFIKWDEIDGAEIVRGYRGSSFKIRKGGTKAFSFKIELFNENDVLAFAELLKEKTINAVIGANPVEIHEIFHGK
jgi:hypothetical protein